MCDKCRSGSVGSSPDPLSLSHEGILQSSPKSHPWTQDSDYNFGKAALPQIRVIQGSLKQTSRAQIFGSGGSEDKWSENPKKYIFGSSAPVRNWELLVRLVWVGRDIKENILGLERVGFGGWNKENFGTGMGRIWGSGAGILGLQIAFWGWIFPSNLPALPGCPEPI